MMLMRKRMALAAVTMLAIASTIVGAQETPRRITLYKTASAAACAGDETVWVDPAGRVYYVKGDKLYGKTKGGGYNCRTSVEAAGYRRLRSR
jgi:predicted membrane-bound mannosyltransferase